VHDVCTGKTVAHFRAHREPLSYLAFDPSGTLLVTAGAGGYEFNIFQIRPGTSATALHENASPMYAAVPPFINRWALVTLPTLFFVVDCYVVIRWYAAVRAQP
jgi:hypothetical protein